MNSGRTRYVLDILLLCTFLLAGSAAGQPTPNAQAVANGIEQRYERARTMQVNFLERYRQGKNIRIESGVAYFSRPGRMRWEYEAPEEKLFLVDGKNAWFYVPADRTATRAKMKESDDWHTPLALLAGRTRRGMFRRMCDKLELLPARSGHTLRCQPKPDKASFREILFEVDSEYRLQRILIREPGDLETEFRFAGWQENVALPEAIFHFAAPKGVAIVDEQSITGPGN